MPIIEVKNLTKTYSLGALTSIKDTIRHGLSRLTRTQSWNREAFKALDNVNFSVNEGEVIGIIGSNGAGKSTLLKHLASITTPTFGEVHVNGSIAPLIEVGAGVNPELTGRENIYLNGAILGIPKKVIHTKLDEIIEFSELKQFIDTPVKRYSSGMTVKLGFSIATNMNADILIIDEVLAVGDLAFQRKCFDRMEKLIKSDKKTVILVSHNIRQIERLCSRVLLLDQGRIILDGPPKEVCNLFYERSDAKIKKQIEQSSGRLISTGEFELLKIGFISNNEIIDKIKTNSDATIFIRFRINKTLLNPTFGIGIHTPDFLYLSTQNTEGTLDIGQIESGTYELVYNISEFPFLPGIYSLRAGVTEGKTTRTVFYSENLFNFQVIPENEEFLNTASRDGFIRLNANISINTL